MDWDEEDKARVAMDNGVDDSRWRPGEMAVDALIRERDELRSQVERLISSEERELNAEKTRGLVEVRELRADNERLRTALEELVDIIDDADARREMDSFTTQPARAALSPQSVWTQFEIDVAKERGKKYDNLFSPQPKDDKP